MRQVLTPGHQYRGAGSARLMMQTLVNDRPVMERDRDGREREGERGSLLGLIASSLCSEDKQKDCGIHLSRVTLSLPDFIPGADQ